MDVAIWTTSFKHSAGRPGNWNLTLSVHSQGHKSGFPRDPPLAFDALSLVHVLGPGQVFRQQNPKSLYRSVQLVHGLNELLSIEMLSFVYAWLGMPTLLTPIHARYVVPAMTGYVLAGLKRHRLKLKLGGEDVSTGAAEDEPLDSCESLKM